MSGLLTDNGTRPGYVPWPGAVVGYLKDCPWKFTRLTTAPAERPAATVAAWAVRPINEIAAMKRTVVTADIYRNWTREQGTGLVWGGG